MGVNRDAQSRLLFTDGEFVLVKTERDQCLTPELMARHIVDIHETCKERGVVPVHNWPSWVLDIIERGLAT